MNRYIRLIFFKYKNEFWQFINDLLSFPLILEFEMLRIDPSRADINELLILFNIISDVWLNVRLTF